MSPVRFGYIGCGFMAQAVHLPNFAALPGCELVALAEVRADLGRRVQAQYAIPKLYTDHFALLADPAIDAVGVSAAFALQGEIARDALLAGKDVFMEKPMAVSLEQADWLLSAVRQSGRRLMVGYMKRYDAGNLLAKEAITRYRASGELGALTYIRNHGFCGDWVAGRDGVILHSDEPIPQAPVIGPAWLPPEHLNAYIGYLQQYTHNVNLLRWLLDAGDDAQVRIVDLDDDSYTGLVVLAVGGVRCVLESGRVSHHAWDEHTQVYFRHGWVKVSSPPLLQRNAPAQVEIYRAGNEQIIQRPLAPYTWSYRQEAAHFIECLTTGAPFGSSAEDTRSDVRLFEEIFRAHLQARGLL